jgi:thiol-disulfide isomerase/thioredoxin
MNERAKQPTVAGFKAAVRAAMLSMQSAGDPMTSPVDIAVVLLAHPSAAAGLSGETGSMVLSMLEDATAAQLAPQAPMIAALAARFNPEATMETLQLSEAYLKIASKALSKEQFAATRAVVIACLTTKLATSEGREKQFLQRMAKSLNGAAARGELVGYPVPTLTCDWVMRADGTTPWKSISDLKGKVVVLDFWATWCGPCVGSFPNVAKLREAYTPEQLEIVGITSLQGSVAHQKRERVDCKGDVEMEHAETLAFMKDMGVTWTIAITAEDVFNADFGIRGIPFVAIIDQDGKVFKVGMHAGDEAGIRAAVDELLAKKAAPAKS